jgi:hypothetical protein
VHQRPQLAERASSTAIRRVPKKYWIQLYISAIWFGSNIRKLVSSLVHPVAFMAQKRLRFLPFL